MNTDYRLLAERLGEFGMEQKRIPYFIGLMQNSDKAFPMGDEDQKWALSRGFVPDKIDLYHLNEENAHLWISDFDYLMDMPSDVPCNDGCLLSLLERKGTLAIKPNRGTGGGLVS